MTQTRYEAARERLDHAIRQRDKAIDAGDHERVGRLVALVAAAEAAVCEAFAAPDGPGLAPSRRLVECSRCGGGGCGACGHSGQRYARD